MMTSTSLEWIFTDFNGQGNVNNCETGRLINHPITKGCTRADVPQKGTEQYSQRTVASVVKHHGPSGNQASGLRQRLPAPSSEPSTNDAGKV